MPTYEYRCSACGHYLEVFQNMKDEPLTECPRCKTASLKRLIGAGAGLLFKGSGFYLTDYRKSSAAPSSGNKETKSPPPKPESPASKKETDSA